MASLLGATARRAVPPARWPARSAEQRLGGCWRPSASSTAGARDGTDPEVLRYASMKPTPTTLQEVLGCPEPWRAAKFVQKEVPIRFAERIRSIEGIRHWQEIPELVEVHAIHLKAFRLLLTTERDRSLRDFTWAVQHILNDQTEVVARMAVGMRTLRQRDPGYARRVFIDELLDSFLLNRLGANVLMSQYLALQDGNRGETGIVDPHCNVQEVCEHAARDAKDICMRHTGSVPLVQIEAHSSVGKDHDRPTMSYIPAALRYIMVELLKNSCRATVEAAEAETARQDALYGPGGAGVDEELRSRPINIVVCADKQNVAICLSDKAKGIPFEVGSHVWSYLYSTAHKGTDKRHGTELAGYGVGLPLSRIFARYLGGSLDLISLPGYGTHAYLWLPRLQSDQVEVVPDCQTPRQHYPSLSDHAL